MSAVLFGQTYCSQCGGEFGPGFGGFSSCSQHKSALKTRMKPQPGQTYLAAVETETAKVRVARFDGGEIRLNISGTSRDLQITLDSCEASALRDLLTEATEEGIEA